VIKAFAKILFSMVAFHSPSGGIYTVQREHRWRWKQIYNSLLERILVGLCI